MGWALATDEGRRKAIAAKFSAGGKLPTAKDVWEAMGKDDEERFANFINDPGLLTAAVLGRPMYRAYQAAGRRPGMGSDVATLARKLPGITKLARFGAWQDSTKSILSSEGGPDVMQDVVGSFGVPTELMNKSALFRTREKLVKSQLGRSIIEQMFGDLLVFQGDNQAFSKTFPGPHQQG